MKKIFFLTVVLSLITISCKKDTVDASSTQNMQSSINDMASSLNTIQQIKFNEALYMLKKFGVEADGDTQEVKALGRLINGKKVPEILKMADDVAQKNGIEWSSTATPSLGEMNIFGDGIAKEFDPNDINAKGLDIHLKMVGDNGSGATSIQIVPQLISSTGTPVQFSGATLESVLEVYSNGARIYSAKNLILNQNFKGFNLRFSSLPSSKVSDNKIDITVSIKTTDKTYKMTKIGIPVNANALRQPVVIKTDTLAKPTDVDHSLQNTDGSQPTEDIENNKKPATDPKTTVSKFLSNLNAKNLKAAFESSNNPNWGSFDNFSNSTSGFGSVNSLQIKSINTASATDKNAQINAVYDVTDKNGNTASLKVTFGLQNTNGVWKIHSYTIK